ncbi:MAG: PQQ-binding-like beta-propeller repeat protein [Planctomycetota bacterium]
MRRFDPIVYFAIPILIAIPTVSGQDQISKKEFWSAARNGDLVVVGKALDTGIDVNSKTDYGATALFFACDRGQLEMVNYLLKRGADPNIKDTFYNATPVTWAQMKSHSDIIISLLKNGGDGADAILLSAVSRNDLDFARRIVEAEVCSETGLLKARDAIASLSGDQAKEKMLSVFAPLDLPETEKISVSPEVLKRYVGNYASDRFKAEITQKKNRLYISFNGGSPSPLKTNSETEFMLGINSVSFELKGETPTALVASFGGSEFRLPATPKESNESSSDKQSHANESVETDRESFEPSSKESRSNDLNVCSVNWPGFRGTGSRGIADGMSPPTNWSLENGQENKIWQAEVPGLGLSSPTIWGDKIFLTTAIAENQNGQLKIGLYGNVDSVEEDQDYSFNVLCFSKEDGRQLWNKSATKGKPAVKRHAKSSHANPTIATDGKYVVAFFGSEGLYCYSDSGELQWKCDFGFLDSGWFYDPGFQWGFGSSTFIHDGKVIVQCDIQDQSFVAAIDIETGTEIWRTERDEIPSWSSPIVHQFGDLEMVITHGTKASRGYDLADGKLLWILKEHSEIVVPTPNVSHGLIFVASGYSPIQPIYAIQPAARGDISLQNGDSSSDSVRWSVKRGGPYMPSPIIYGDYLYCCSNTGILTCYRAVDGMVVYKKRMKASGGGLSFTASPVAADGNLFLTAEDGRVLVVKSGPTYELLKVNDLNEPILATPAISKQAIYFRTQNSLIAVGTNGNQKESQELTN